MHSLTRFFAFSALISASMLAVAADESSMPMQGQMPMNGQMQQKMQEHIKQMDSNGDGNISKQEFMANCEKRFQKVDANGDGQITKEERQQMRSQMMEHKGPMGGQMGTP